MAKHFVKTFIAFAGLIILGLVGVFLINYFNKGENSSTTADTQAEIAK